ncbi:DNA-binding protein [Halorussus salilacus]|uniref:DNA-binding protein n=1 Tax=Halorussus salilacus TaxID=2953750 RepID=UPI00209C7301|nr:DNA-binding protein [Halorussus salilacus]USZ67183.1 DNA-binding protein [Halorussus salilacus]
MSEQPDDERLEELRKQKMQELQEQGGREEAQEQAQQQADAQKQAMLRQHLTDGARKRLNSVRMSKPDFADQVERQVLALAQSGRVNGKIDEQKMKELLRELKPDSKSFNIRRR